MTENKPRGQYPAGGPDWATVAQWVDDGRPDLNPDGTPAIPCQWYALCDRGAIGLVPHPILGTVPTCKRCAEKHDLDLQPFPVDGSA